MCSITRPPRASSSVCPLNKGLSVMHRVFSCMGVICDVTPASCSLCPLNKGLVTGLTLGDTRRVCISVVGGITGGPLRCVQGALKADEPLPHSYCARPEPLPHSYCGLSPSLTLIVRGLLAAASSRPVRLPALTKNYPRVNKESPPPFAQEARSHWKGEPLIFLVLTHKNFNVSGKRGAPRPGNLAAAF